MVDSKPSPSTPASKTESKPEASKPAESSQGASTAGDGLAAAMKADHEARTTVPGRDGVDARLDNRRPEDFEPVSFGPDDAKPQHVDGPDLAGQAEHTRKVLSERKQG